MRRIARITVALATVTLVAAGSLSGCAPSPEDVCGHMMELAKKEGMPVSGDEALKQCVASVEKEKELQGYFDYRTQAGCVMDAESLEDAIKCDKAE